MAEPSPSSADNPFKEEDMKTRYGSALVVVGALLLSACSTLIPDSVLPASRAGDSDDSRLVTEELLVQRTSLALGLAADQFTISARTGSGIRTDYSVATKAGRQYACYVTSTSTFTGSVVSDALCTELQSGATSGQSAAPARSECNALLRAAGKCS
jgi:hypothetical protein